MPWGALWGKWAGIFCVVTGYVAISSIICTFHTCSYVSVQYSSRYSVDVLVHVVTGMKEIGQGRTYTIG